MSKNDSTTIYERAKAAVEARAAQFPADSVMVWESDALKIYISRGDGELEMTAVNGNPRKAARVQVGHLDPMTGWRFTLNHYSYSDWAKRAAKLAGQPEPEIKRPEPATEKTDARAWMLNAGPTLTNERDIYYSQALWR